MSRRGRLKLGAFLVALLSASFVGSAGGVRARPATCAQPASPRVAVDTSGDAVAVWLCSRPTTAVQAAARPAGSRRWTAPQDILRLAAGASVSDLALAVDDRGDAAAIWRRYSVAKDPTHAITSVVQAAVRPAAAGTWDAPQDLSGSGANAALPQVGLDRRGDAVAVWLAPCNDAAEEADCTGSIHAAERRLATGTWSLPEQISAPGQAASAPRAAIDPAGDAFAVWKSESGVQAAVRPASKRDWGAPHDLGPAAVMTEPPEVAVDPAGNAIVVYVAGTAVRSVVGSSATGRWGPPQDLPNAGQSYPEFLQAALGLSAAGEAVAVWRRGSEDAPPPVVQASVRSPGSGRWSAPQTLSSANAEAGLPQVAVDAAGNAVAVWQDGVRTSPFICPSRHCTFPAPNVEASTLSATTESWSEPRRWRAAGGPQIAVDPDGEGVAVWVGPEKHQDAVLATDRTAGSNTWSAPEPVSAVAARCTVPPLVGLRLAEARAALRRDDCRTGRVAYGYSRTVGRGRVLAQRRRPGTSLADGARVDIVVSKGRRSG